MLALRHKHCLALSGWPLWSSRGHRGLRTTLPPLQCGSGSGGGGGDDRQHTHRTRLTNLLWRERYAIGMVDKEGAPVSQRRSRTELQQIYRPAMPYTPVAKRMRDSYCEVVLPFRTDLQLREEYVNFFRGLRLGKVLEDLDALAASIAYRHCHDGREGELPLTIVTASMDRMDLLNPLRPDLDLKLSGHVTYVGRTSLEVTVRVESCGEPRSPAPIDESGEQLAPHLRTTWAPICLCKFTMVARDPNTLGPVAISPLILDTPREKQLFKLGEESKRHKLEAAKTDLSRVAPTDEERQIIHDLYLEQISYEDSSGQINPALVPATVAFEHQTRLQTVKICHPQERNIHSSIFGGFLMREAFELGYTVAMMYIKGRPWTVALDEIAFRKPVPIGSILELTSQVEYAEGEPHATFQVSVTAEVVSDIRTGKKEVTNVFYFTFARGKGDTDCAVRRMLPRTYGEAMQYVRGRRRKERGIQLKAAQMAEFVVATALPQKLD